MTEVQITGISLLLTALSVYFLALYIEKTKHYSLFAGWDSSRISDIDACGKMMCKGLKVFALVMGLGGAFIFLTQTGGETAILVFTLVPLAPLLHYIFKARRLYWS